MPDVDKNGSALRPVIAVIPHMSFFSSRLHLLQQSIWQQTTPQITRQNQASHFQNLTLEPLHSQDPNSWVTLRIAHWSTVPLGKPRGPTFLKAPLTFHLSTFWFNLSRLFGPISPTPDSLPSIKPLLPVPSTSASNPSYNNVCLATWLFNL